MTDLFNQIISYENLFLAWKEFRSGKRHKADVQAFERNLDDNLYLLHLDLKNKTYRHGKYTSFRITDPKQRHIHKAEVRDRVVHHAIYRIIYPIFDRSFIFDSYSCRNGKGTHKAVNRLETFIRKASRNYTAPCFALKCDVKKFFDSVDHQILFEIIQQKIYDAELLEVLKNIIGSYPTNKTPAHQLDLFGGGIERERERERESFSPQTKLFFSGKGIPIGNLTSQLFANIYLNELDQFVKHQLQIKYYVRYCDDFVILDQSPEELKGLLSKIEDFLESKLKLRLHQNKMTIRKPKQGIDFLGYVILRNCTVLRTKTKKRIVRKANFENLSSYLGLLKHCKGSKLERQIAVMADLSEKGF